MRPLSLPPIEKSPRGRLLCFDLENRPLAYWYDGQTTSEITAFAWKWKDEDAVHTMLLRPDGFYEKDDKTRLPRELAFSDFASILESAGLVFGHNIRRHDLPMFQSHLLRAQLPPLKPVLTTDTLKDYPRRKDMSASLENLAALYGLGGEKFHMSQPAWEEANRLTDGGIELARKRVASDVLLQERLRDKLASLGILGRPRMWRP